MDNFEIIKCGKGRKILNIKEISYLSKIVESELDDVKKMELMDNFCSYKVLTESINYYSRIGIDIKQFQCLKKIIDFCNDKNYIKYFKNPYKCSNEELDIKIKKLIQVNSILNSNVNDYIKVEALISLFKNSEEFKKSYSLLVKYGNKDPKLDLIQNILNNFDKLLGKFKDYEDKGIVDDVYYLISIKEYHNNYEYAKFVINYYINFSESYKKGDFLSLIGIDEDYFNFCAETIKELDVTLYNKYLQKKEKNKKIYYYSIYDKLSDISTAIKNNCFKDGTHFDLLEFIKRLPFSDSDDQVTNIFDFIVNENKKANYSFNDIINYMYRNKLISTFALKPINIDKINSYNPIINGIEITKEINEKIINYLKANNIPLVNKAYSIVRNKYINGEIVLEFNNNNNKRKSIIIIPTCKKQSK